MRRKITIILTMITIAVFIGTAAVFFLFHNPPSCDDGVQNGQELGVDCGGLCANACAERPRPLLDVWTRAFPLAEGVYAAVAYIENQNENWYVPSVQYEIVLYDNRQSIITRASQRTLIMPNGVTPIFVPHILTGASAVASASFRFTEEPRFVPRPEPHRFTVSDITTDIRDNTPPRVSAVVRNDGDVTAEGSDFVVIVYDEDGVAIAASRTFEEYIPPGESRRIQFTWVYPFVLRAGRCAGARTDERECLRKVKRVEIIPVMAR